MRASRDHIANSSFCWIIIQRFVFCIRVCMCTCSVAQSCLILCDPMDCRGTSFHVHYQLLELVQTHVHQVGDAIQPSHTLSTPSPPDFNLSHHHPWTVAHQASLSMGFSRQEYWSGLPFPSPGNLPNPGIKPRSPTLQADALTSEPPGKPR